MRIVLTGEILLLIFCISYAGLGEYYQLESNEYSNSEFIEEVKADQIVADVYIKIKSGSIGSSYNLIKKSREILKDKIKNTSGFQIEFFTFNGIGKDKSKKKECLLRYKLIVDIETFNNDPISAYEKIDNFIPSLKMPTDVAIKIRNIEFQISDIEKYRNKLQKKVVEKAKWLKEQYGDNVKITIEKSIVPIKIINKGKYKCKLLLEPKYIIQMKPNKNDKKAIETISQ